MDIILKFCNKCKSEKEVTSFHKDKTKIDGYKNSCKECQRNYSSKFYVDNRERINNYAKEYYYKHSNDERYKESRKKYMDNWIDKNNEYKKAYNKKYNFENKEKIRENKKVYRMLNKEKIENYKKDNKIKIRNTTRKYWSNRLKNDKLFYLSNKIRNLIRICIKNNKSNKKSKTIEILGCNFDFFKNHIESKFESWMNWDNHGKYNGEFCYGWDIDHIIPISSAKSEEDIIRLNHYSNFQPLDSYKNRVIKRNILSNG